MSLIFKPEKHEYVSLDNPDFKWISITTLIGYFKQPFDAIEKSTKSSKNKKSPWYGMTPEAIREAWSSESHRAMDLGTWYHNREEARLCSEEYQPGENGEAIPVFKPMVNEDGIKYAPNQKLQNGIYPEHFAFLSSAGICGQSDRVDIINKTVNISDYKTNKEIKFEGFKSWDGKTQKMASPISHVDDCNYWHYALQLSFYMYMIIKHNPTFIPGKLTIHHISFENSGMNEHGYPITLLDADLNPVIRNIVEIDLPYMKSEVVAILEWLKTNKHKIKAK